MYRKIASLLLILALLVPALSLAQEESAPRMAGYDGEGTYRDWNTNLFFARMTERTGIAFTYEQYTDYAKYAAYIDSLTGSSDLPDVLFKAELTPSDCIALLESGALIDLKPYINEENCPNLTKILAENPDVLAAITLPGGQIAALPYLSSAPTQNVLWINSKWLKNLKLSVPADAASLVSVLTAFRDQDPNQNGRKDEIPLGFLGAFDLKFLAHAFGLTANDYNVFAKDGKACFMPLEENFRVFITWCKDLYDQKLIDKNGFSTTDSLRQQTSKDAAQTYGIVITTLPTNLFPSEWLSDYEIVPPLSYNGAQVYRSLTGGIYRGAFAVTSACESPEAMLKWVDFLYSEEGSILASIGQEGEDYTVDTDGTWRLTDSAANNQYFTGSTLISSGATPPGISSEGFQARYAESAVSKLTMQLQAVNDVAKLPFPSYSLSKAQENTITPLQNQIGEHVDLSIARWILGETEISDESFSDFENTLKELGLDEFMAFWQGILDAQGGKD